MYILLPFEPHCPKIGVWHPPMDCIVHVRLKQQVKLEFPAKMSVVMSALQMNGPIHGLMHSCTHKRMVKSAFHYHCMKMLLYCCHIACKDLPGILLSFKTTGSRTRINGFYKSQQLCHMMINCRHTTNVQSPHCFVNQSTTGQVYYRNISPRR